MDDLLTYSQTEEEHLEHIQLVFQKLQEAGIKLKVTKCEVFKSQIEYLGYLLSGQGIPPMKLKVQAIMDLVPATNIAEKHHMISFLSYYMKFFPVSSDMV